MTCRVLRIDEQLYGCEELPAGQPVLCDVLLADAAGTQRVLSYPDEALTAQNIQEGDTVALLPDGTLKKLRQYRIILSADTASEVRQMPSQKRR